MTFCPPYGYRIVGTLETRRKLVDARRAFLAYAACDERAELSREAYLSAFQFGDDFGLHLAKTGSTRDFTGACWSRWLWFDIDRDNDLDAALKDVRGLAAFLLDRYASLDDDDLLTFFSGSKGFHVGVPTTLWEPLPSVCFHRHTRRLAEALAGLARVRIDASIYDKVRAFRAPNSRHPKTRLYKRRLCLDELLGLSVERIRALASRPEPFEIHDCVGTYSQAVADWTDAVRAVESEAKEKTLRRQAVADGPPRLNKLTTEFIRHGATEGDRHRLLFSAAANLAEFGCSPALAHALLTESALDSGLSPADARRQIECGLNYRPTVSAQAPGSET